MDIAPSLTGIIAVDNSIIVGHAPRIAGMTMDAVNMIGAIIRLPQSQ
jgi:hypothetical protein